MVRRRLIEVAKQEAEMRTLCAAVRARYSGQLTYGANHGQENSIGWWDAVRVQPLIPLAKRLMHRA